MQSPALARRASQLSPALPASALAGQIAFDSGHAFPGVLPDLTAEAATALERYRHETLQYAPRAGLPELRAWIAKSRHSFAPVFPFAKHPPLHARHFFAIRHQPRAFTARHDFFIQNAQGSRRFSHSQRNSAAASFASGQCTALRQ